MNFCSNKIKSSGRPELITPLGRQCYSLGGVDSALYRFYVNESLDRQNSNVLYQEGLLYAQFWRYHDAVKCFTKCIEMRPEEPLYYRMRGHRYISLRMFDKAAADLEKAAEIKSPKKDRDLKWNIYYHLGLAYYLSGDFEKALNVYMKCLDISNSDEIRIAVLNWIYNTHIMLGKVDESNLVLSKVKKGMKINENITYYNSLIFHQGKITEDSLLSTASSSLDSLTISYSIGISRLSEKDSEGAHKIFEKIARGFYWPAFGLIAAEAYLARLNKQP